MNVTKRNDLIIKVRELCNKFGYTEYLKSINDGEKFEISYGNFYSIELELGKENTNMRLRWKASSWPL